MRRYFIDVTLEVYAKDEDGAWATAQEVAAQLPERHGVAVMQVSEPAEDYSYQFDPVEVE